MCTGPSRGCLIRGLVVNYYENAPMLISYRMQLNVFRWVMSVFVVINMYKNPHFSQKLRVLYLFQSHVCLCINIHS